MGREHADCWLREFAPHRVRECRGRMDPAHLIDRHRLKLEGREDLIPDGRTWVRACRRHHTLFDSYAFPVPRTALPEPFLALMAELGLDWWVDRRYGPLKTQGQLVNEREADIQAARDGYNPNW